MKIITFQDIVNLNISPKECLSWAEEIIRRKDQMMLPSKISLSHGDGIFCNVMPSVIVDHDGIKREGTKIVTRYPGRVPALDSQIVLIDVETGEFLAVMDGTWITAMRTGAVAAHSIGLFAKKDYHTIGMMGLGNVSGATLLILAEKNPERELNIKLLRYKNQEEDFAGRFAKYENIHFSFADTPEEMISGSEVVISGATYLADDVCEVNCFEEGVLLLPIHTRGFANCDTVFDKVFADDTGHVCHFGNFGRFKQFAQVSDVVTGKAPGRENEKERILVYNIGISIHDICFASNIYNMICTENTDCKIQDVDMCGPTEKFWI